MRKETYKIAKAFYNRRPASAARTRTNGEVVWLHDNCIAWRTLDGDIGFTLKGWPTVTTRDRINGILSVFGYGRWGVAQRKGQQYLVQGAEKITTIGDHEHFYISDLKGMENTIEDPYYTFRNSGYARWRTA